jgi:peroxiredoxin
MTTTMLRPALLALLPLALALSCSQSPAPQAGPAPASAPAAKPTVAGDGAAPTGDAVAALGLVDPAAKAELGQPAPDFTLADLDGKTHALSQHRGKIVVLEWFNPQCPFVKYAHSEGPLRDMAARETAAGVVWIAVNSGAPGKQGAGVDNSREGAKTYGMTHPIVLDESGAVGRAYGATKTPHMFVVDEKGTLVYRGGLDNAPMGEVDGDGPKIAFVEQALAELRAGKPVATADTRAYGCSVKYAS